jgi:hypothetical protein
MPMPEEVLRAYDGVQWMSDGVARLVRFNPVVQL